MKFSFVVCNYNQCEFLPYAVDSCLNQTYKNIEVLVVDDGSNDDSLLVLEKFQGKVKTIANKNSGQANSYNTGFSASTGDLVLFLDADDFVYENCAENVVSKMIDSPPKVAKIHYKLNSVGKHGENYGRVVPSCRLPRGRLKIENHLFGKYESSPGSGNVYTRAFLEKVMPLSNSLQMKTCGDAALIFLALSYGRILAIDESLGAYRVHGDNDSQVSKEQLMGECGAKIISDFCKRQILLEKKRDFIYCENLMFSQPSIAKQSYSFWSKTKFKYDYLLMLVDLPDYNFIKRILSVCNLYFFGAKNLLNLAVWHRFDPIKFILFVGWIFALPLCLGRLKKKYLIKGVTL